MSRARPLLGTMVIVSGEGDGPGVVHAVAQAMESVEEVDRRMSVFRPESDVARLNEEAWDRWVEVHPDTLHVLRVAEDWTRCSGGVFDVTVGGKLAQYGYIPSPKNRGCWPQRDGKTPFFLFDKRAKGRLPRIRFIQPVRVDLGGIAKGFAVDRALQILRQFGLHQGWVNAGGDMAFFSQKPEPLWARHPDRPDQLVYLGKRRTAAVAGTSGNNRMRRVGGESVTPYVREGSSLLVGKGVTVIAPLAISADALTKIVLLGPPSMSRRLLAESRAKALVLGKRPLQPDFAIGSRTERKKPAIFSKITGEAKTQAC